MGLEWKELSLVWNIKPYSKQKHSISLQEIVLLKKGEKVVRKNGEVLEPSKCCKPPEESRSYVYAADTAYTPKVVEAAKGATLLYHEATFMEEEKEIARKTMHSTASDAGRVALAAGVSGLMLGHFSNRYRDLSGLHMEAVHVF